MTSLLAFFIILTSLAKDQTGVDLYEGTGSFVRALDTFGLPGVFPKDRSKRLFQGTNYNPQYAAGGGQDKLPNDESAEQDSDNPNQRTLDQELESFERLILELEHRFDVQSLPKTKGQVAFDLFDPLDARRPRLPPGAGQIIAQLVPTLKTGLHRVEIVVWATTPKRTAWQRAVEQSAVLRDEMISLARLTADEQSRLTAMGCTWPVSDAQRPSLTIRVSKIDPLAR
jgi:hypothetical protein